MKDFQHYRLEGRVQLGHLSQGFLAHDLDEQAVPSYLHKNYLVSFTFWKRLEIAARECRQTPMRQVLDFGCGIGAMFPFFNDEVKGKVLAYDIDPRAQSLAKKYSDDLGSDKIEILGSEDELRKITPGSLDAIVALDVLEHVENLPYWLELFDQWLSPQGRLIVSSPTESLLYRFTRIFGGPHYHGHTHLRGASDIEEGLRQHFQVDIVGRIFPLFNYFILASCKKALSS